MGFSLGSLFSSSRKDEGFQAIPDSPEGKKARTFLTGLFERNLQFPTQTIPGLSGMEKEGQGIVRNWMRSGTTPGVATATNELSRTVKGGYDPVNSMAFKGYRAQSKLEEDEAVAALKRSLQLKGMNASSPETRAEGKTRRGYSADRMSFLGDLFGRERDRQLGAAPVLADVARTGDRETVEKAQVGAQFGAAERMVETAQEQAIFDAVMRTLLAPYNEQMNAAGTVLGEPRYMYDPGVTSPSIFSQVMGVAAQGAGAYYGGKAGAKGK